MATYPKFDFLDVAEIAGILASVVLIAYAGVFLLMATTVRTAPEPSICGLFGICSK